MDGLPDAVAHAIGQSPVALALAFGAILVARVLDRRLGELVAMQPKARRPKPRPDAPRS